MANFHQLTDLVYKIVVSNDDHEYKKVLVDAGNGEILMLQIQRIKTQTKGQDFQIINKITNTTTK